MACVTDYRKAGFGRRDFARDEAQPHVVRAADFRVGEEIQRAGTEQEFDRQTVGRQTEGDDFRECLFGLVGAPELGIGEIKTIEDAQLLPLGTSRGRLVVAQRLCVIPGFIELGAFADQGGDREPRHVEFVGRAAGWRLRRADLPFDDAILGQ